MSIVEVYEWLTRNKVKVINALGDKSVQEMAELFNSTGASSCDEAFNLLRPSIRLFHIPEQRFTQNYDNSCSVGCLLKTANTYTLSYHTKEATHMEKKAYARS